MPAALPDLENYQHPLRKWRLEKGYTVEQLAKLWKRSEGYLHQIETRVRPAGRKMAELISTMTGLTMDELLKVPLRDKKTREREKRKARREAARG